MFRLGLFILLSVCIVGCWSGTPAPQAGSPTEEDYQKVKDGMTIEEVEAVLGQGAQSDNPLLTMGTVSWTKPDGTTGMVKPDAVLEWRDRKPGMLGDRIFVVMFSKDKVVTKTTYEMGP